MVESETYRQTEEERIEDTKGINQRQTTNINKDKETQSKRWADSQNGSV